ncbi:MAG: 50S ribosomal protein L21 [Bacilli bacterium]|nr:50S ribosomal protein L21 [Bacilli bacterium]
MKAVFKACGKQYYAEEGSVLYLEKLDAKEGDKITFDEVLMLDDKVGSPLIKGAKVEAKVIKHGKQKKIKVYKYRQKKKYRRTQGHRQPYTKVEISKVIG